MTNTKLTNPPEEEGEERAVEALKGLGKAVIGSSVPLGPFITEAIDFFYKRPIEERRENWMEEFTVAFNELSEKVDKLAIGKLSENEEFITILHRATDIALRTHAKEKRILLRNAIVSAGSPNAPELDKQTFFLHLVDELTVNQVLVLLLYKDPLGWFKKRNITPTVFSSAPRIVVLEQAFPNLSNSRFLRELVTSELERQGLLGGLSGMVNRESVYNPMTSELGVEFIEYVKADTIAV